MGVGFLIIGLILIGIGFWMAADPNMIAGISTMSSEKKRKVDLKGLSRTMRNIFIAMGAFIALGCNILIWLGYSEYINLYFFTVLLFFFVLLFLKTSKYFPKKIKRDKNKQ